LTEADVFHHWMPMHHIGGQLHGVMSTVVGGAALAIFPTFSTSQFLTQARQAGCSIFIGFANVLEYLLSTPESPSDRSHALRVGIIAGGTAPLRRRFESRFGITLVDSYGMTEAEPLTLPLRTSVCSSGRINPDFEIAVLDADDRPVPIGSAGTIAFRPREPHVMMAEYDGDAASTVSAWRNLWFHTADIGWIDSQGHLFMLHRMHAAIRRRGENIASRDIEAVLMLHPEVSACAVIGIPDDGDTDIKAIVVLKAGSSLDAAELYGYCESNLARVMVPQVIEIRNSLPYTDIGKLDRGALLAATGQIVPRPPR
jgi:crotonobetaine/carnitine-CoA ligase